MGLIGLLVSVAVIVLGAGYYSFGMAPTAPMIFTNDTDISTEQVSPVAPSQVSTLIDQAKDVKALVENKSSEEVKLMEEITGTEAPKTSPVSGGKGATTIINRLMTTGFLVPKKERTIDTIVLHSSYNPNGDTYSVSEIVKIYESYGVSAHYLIDRKGTIYHLVENQNIAYHAGVSKMPDGRRDVNDFSIGIEIMNKEDTEFTKSQYQAVNDLIAYLKEQYRIKYVVGHGDIAPGRKTDPWNFDWKKLK